MTDGFASAKEICDRILQETGAALLAHDFPSFESLIHLPTTVETFEGRRVIETREELRRTFEDVCHHYDTVSATDLVRHVVAAEHVDEDTIRATVQCRVLCGTELRQAPYIIFSKYIRLGGEWRIAESTYVLDDAPIYTRALSHGLSRPRAKVDK